MPDSKGYLPPHQWQVDNCILEMFVEIQGFDSTWFIYLGVHWQVGRTPYLAEDMRVENFSFTYIGAWFSLKENSCRGQKIKEYIWSLQGRNVRFQLKWISPEIWGDISWLLDQEHELSEMVGYFLGFIPICFFWFVSKDIQACTSYLANLMMWTLKLCFMPEELQSHSTSMVR